MTPRSLDQPAADGRRAAIMAAVMRYANARVGRALYNGDEQQASVDMSWGAVEDDVRALADERDALKARVAAMEALCEAVGSWQKMYATDEDEVLDGAFGEVEATRLTEVLRCYRADRAKEAANG